LSRGASENQFKKQAAAYILQQIAENNVTTVTRLLDYGVIINPSNEDEETPLTYAVMTNQIDMLYLLLSRGANPDSATNGQTALATAAFKGQIDFVRALLEHNAEVDKPDPQGITPLMYSVYGGQSEVFDLLLSNKASIDVKNKDGETLSVIAAESNCFALMAIVPNKEIAIQCQKLKAYSHVMPIVPESDHILCYFGDKCWKITLAKLGLETIVGPDGQMAPKVDEIISKFIVSRNLVETNTAGRKAILEKIEKIQAENETQIGLSMRTLSIFETGTANATSEREPESGALERPEPKL